MIVTVKTYPDRIEAELAKTTLDAAGIPCFIKGVGVAMEGGVAGVQLQVPHSEVKRALKLLGES